MTPRTGELRQVPATAPSRSLPSPLPAAQDPASTSGSPRQPGAAEGLSGPQPERELPIRVIDTAAGPVLRGLCGEERAIIDPRRRQDPTRHMTPDVSPAALMQAVMHARSCQRCKNEQQALDLRLAAAGGEQGIAWAHFNPEADLLEHLIDGAVQVTGSDPVAVKEERLAAFARGEIRVLVTKPRIASWGLNFQNCHRMTYFPSHSFESWYQAVRRCWRFGQSRPVTVDVVTTTGGERVLANLERKGAQADRMFTSLVSCMRDAAGVRRTDIYDTEAEIPRWVA